MAQEHPKRITGGCNCGGVRYQVDFAADHDWKRAPNTCQCTQCRKMSGSLVFHFHTVKTDEIVWLSQSTYAEYNSSAGFFRGFCSKCGSSIAWIDRGAGKGEMELAAGTIDEAFLVGGRDAGDRALGAFGVALADPGGVHVWVRNEIAGVTDVQTAKGVRYWKGLKEGPIGSTE